MIETPNTEQPPVDEPITPEFIAGYLKDNPDVHRELNDSTPAGAAPSPANVGGPVSGLWARVKQWDRKVRNVTEAPERIKENVETAAKRGVVQTANELSNTVVGGLTKVHELTGSADRYSPEGRKAWMERYEKPTAEWNPLQFDVDKRAGEAPKGVAYDLITGISQFAAGFAATGVAFKAVGIAGKVTQVAKAGKAARIAAKTAENAAQGMVADMAFVAPQQQRLSDAVKGTWLENPVSRMLASDADDTELEGRIKNGLEGLVLGSTIDGLLGGIKFLRSKGAVGAPTPKPAPTDVVTVRPTDEGTYQVVPLREDPTPSDGKIVAPEASSGQPGASSSALPESPETPAGHPEFTDAADAEVHAAGLNVVARNDAVEDVTANIDVDAWRTQYDKLNEVGDSLSPDEWVDGYQLNPKYNMTTDEAKNLVRAVVDTDPFPHLAARDRPLADADVIDHLVKTGQVMNADEAVALARETHTKVADLPKTIAVLKMTTAGWSTRLAQMAKSVAAAPENAVMAEAFADGLNKFAEFHAWASGVSSRVGQALRVHQLSTDGIEATIGVAGTVDAKTIKAYLDTLTKQDMKDLARAIDLSRGNPQKMLEQLAGITAAQKAAKAAAKKAALMDAKAAKGFLARTAQSTGTVMRSWRIESMLSGLGTHFGNLASNAAFMFAQPVEMWWGGLVTGNKAMMSQAVDLAGVTRPMELLGDIWDSMKAMGHAANTGRNVLDPSDPHGIGSLVDLTAESHTFKDMLLFVGHLPSRALMSSDEFFKQMNYRAAIRSQILRQAREEGVSDAAEIARRLTDVKKFLFTGERAGLVDTWAMDFSRYATFTRELPDGSIGRQIQEASQEHALVSMVVPFVRTPTNIFSAAWERAPVLNVFHSELRKDFLSGDPERRAIAAGRATVGAMVAALGFTLAYNKMVTGGGPMNKDLKDTLRGTGWQPYSVRIGDRYVSLRRADPIVTTFGLMADLVEMRGNMADEEWSDVVWRVMASVAANATSKTYMQGISDFFDAVSQPSGQSMKKFGSNYVGSFIPNIARRQNTDMVIHETRTFLDEMRARVPGLSSTLEPKRNLFGEPVMRPPGYFNASMNPFTISGKADPDGVFNELVGLGKGISMPPESMGGGEINLTDRDLFSDRKRADGSLQSPYDRWLELIGESGLKENLTALMKSDGYKNSTDAVRLLEVSGRVQMYQEAAKWRMVSEYPSVQRAMVQKGILDMARLRGNLDETESALKRTERLFVRPKRRDQSFAIPQ